METEESGAGGVSGAMVRLFASLLRLSGTFGNFVDGRAAALRANWKRELRRAAAMLIYSRLVVFCFCSAAVLAAFALLSAFWETHRVLVASLLATAFLLLGALVLWLLYRDTR